MAYWAYFWNTLSGIEQIYVWLALLGAMLFGVRLILMALGADSDIDAPEFDSDVGDSDGSFRALSLEAIGGFFMMFGLVGLAMLKTTEASAWLVTIVAFIAGLVTVWVIQWAFKGMMSLQSTGNLDMNQAIGKEGTVYLTIAPGQVGKVEVVVGERLRVVDATSQMSEPLATGSRVVVSDITDTGMFVVKTL